MRDHLLIPYAACTGEDGTTAPLPPLPQLGRLLGRLTATDRLDGDAYTLNPPHERALAAAWGWQADDGCIPLAALMAHRDGLSPVPGSDGWGLVTPVHWDVGTDQVRLADPAGLQLDEADARALYDAIRPLFVDEGWALHWGAATRWYVVHPTLATLPTASLDRVIGRNVDLWLGTLPEARRIRRLQSEVQMLLYTHPVNDARQAAGLPAVNSFWLSGCGCTPRLDAPPPLRIDDRLRAPALAGDAAGWAAAWQTLDAEVLAPLLQACQGGASVALTLCGERAAQHYALQPQPWWRRLVAPRVRASAALASL